MLNRTFTLAVVFLALVLCVVGASLSAIAIWLINGSTSLVDYAKRIP